MSKYQPWRIVWEIEESQVNLVKDFYQQYENNIFVATRERRNVQKQGLDLSKEFLWKNLIACLLTTQQKSGPESRVAQFIRTDPFPLSLKYCIDNLDKLDIESQIILQSFGGLRRSTIIAEHLKENLQKIVGNNWLILKKITEEDTNLDEKQWERYLVEIMQQEIKGFGPKQSRNFLQILGITKYEIPIDSRITDWLNRYNFPIHLIASGLADPYYYQFISDGIQQLCEQVGILPCILDAAIFSSYDKEEWTEENSAF